MNSLVVKRSIIVGRHKTSVSLEDAFWNALKEIARIRGITLSDIVSEIDRDRQNGNLSSAIRIYVLKHVGHRRMAGDMIGKREMVARTG